MTEMDDVLKDRLNSLKADRERAKAALKRAKSHSSQASRSITRVQTGAVDRWTTADLRSQTTDVHLPPKAAVCVLLILLMREWARRPAIRRS
jgi:chromosome condensin MukBEF ATPase and DNA-binding subunit MukB